MSKSKTILKKSPEPKPKYNLGQKLYTITFHKGKAENIVEVMVRSVRATKIAMVNDIGKNAGTITTFSYGVTRPDIAVTELWEIELYPSFQSVANKFAEAFLIQRLP
jgi:hypothetical protein